MARVLIVAAAVVVVIAAYVAADPSAAPGTQPVRFVLTLLLGALAVFVVAAVRRVIVDSKVVDDHPDEQLNLIRDPSGRAIGFDRVTEKGLEAFAKDLIDDDAPEPGSGAR